MRRKGSRTEREFPRKKRTALGRSVDEDPHERGVLRHIRRIQGITDAWRPPDASRVPHVGRRVHATRDQHLQRGKFSSGQS
jgi:hypothetical protein